MHIRHCSKLDCAILSLFKSNIAKILSMVYSAVMHGALVVLFLIYWWNFIFLFVVVLLAARNSLFRFEL